MLSRYGYTHRRLYYRTPYDEYRRLLRAVGAVEDEVQQAREGAMNR